jgi:RNA-directed DNA polymerase
MDESHAGGPGERGQRRKRFSLMGKVWRPSRLDQAWRRVKRNRGAAGVDRLSTERFELEAEKYLQELSKDLRTGDYRPQAVRRVYIPKGEGKYRPLGIPTVKAGLLFLISFLDVILL